MQNETLTLGIPEKALAMIRDGTAYRDGGIVRETDSRQIVAFLQDADSSVSEFAKASVVPLAIMGISIMAVNHRLKLIETELRSLEDALNNIDAKIDFANVKLDGQMIGSLLGSIHACHLDISAGITHKCADYRHVFLEYCYQFRSMVEGGLNEPELFRQFEPMLQRYAQAMFLAGIAARDVSYYLNDEKGALQLATELSHQSLSLAELAHKKIKAPSALFWIEKCHMDFVSDIKESAARLKSHEEALQLLPKSEIKKLIARQLDI